MAKGNIDKNEPYFTEYSLIFMLKNAEERPEKEGWIDADVVEKELGIRN